MNETRPSRQAREMDRRILSTFTVPPTIVGPPPPPQPSDLQRRLALGHFGDSLGRGYGYPSSTIHMVESLFANGPSDG